MTDVKVEFVRPRRGEVARTQRVIDAYLVLRAVEEADMLPVAARRLLEGPDGASLRMEVVSRLSCLGARLVHGLEDGR